MVCYVGTCFLYAVYQIVRACRRREAKKAKLKLNDPDCQGQGKTEPSTSSSPYYLMRGIAFQIKVVRAAAAVAAAAAAAAAAVVVVAAAVVVVVVMVMAVVVTVAVWGIPAGTVIPLNVIT